MAPERTPDDLLRDFPAIIARLCEKGPEFGFFQAVWLLERLKNHGSPVGGEGPVRDEPIRFRPDVGLGFPASDVKRVAVERSAEGRPLFQVDITFLGLYGVSTPMPLHYAVDVLRQVEGVTSPTQNEPPPRDAQGVPMASHSPLRDFLDVINHRLISLFYRAWTKYRYHVKYGVDKSDDVTAYLLRLIGVQPEWDIETLGVEPIRMLRYAGALTQRPRSAGMLAGTLHDYWKGMPVDVRQGVGRWVALDPSNLNRIGSANCRLGEDCVVGEQVYDVSGAIEVAMGPMDWVTYESFLPDTVSFRQTQRLTRMFSTDPLALRIELKIKENQIPEMRLDSGPGAGRLGYTSWVRTREVPETSVSFSPASES